MRLPSPKPINPSTIGELARRRFCIKCDQLAHGALDQEFPLDRNTMSIRALHAAVCWDEPGMEAIEQLLQHGSEVDHFALHVAVSRQADELVDMFLPLAHLDLENSRYLARDCLEHDYLFGLERLMDHKLLPAGAGECQDLLEVCRQLPRYPRDCAAFLSRLVPKGT